MPTLRLPLDISKPAHQILVDAINEENRTSLNHLEFDYTAPVTTSLLNSDINTSIVLTPITASGFYNTATVYYKRMDLAEIYASKQIEIETGVRVLLSELIPEINLHYGINLTDDDYIDQTLPVVDPLDPGAQLSVTLQAAADSVLFFGSCQVVLDEPAPITDADNVERKFYITVAVPNANPQLVNKVVCVKADFTQLETYQALRNASAITDFDAQQTISLSDGKIVMRGVFKFTAAIGGITQNTYDSATIITADNGNVVVAYSATDKAFGDPSINTWFGHWNLPFKYIIDSGDTIGTDPTTKIYRYDNLGILDLSYVATGITYVPTLVAPDKNNKLYTVSPTYSDAGINKIRIDRLLADGTLDLDFASIFLTKTGAGALHGVIDIQPNDDGGMYIALGAGTDLSSITVDNIPVVNGSALVPGGEMQVYAWNPVIKFTETGAIDTEFKNRLLNSSPNSILKPTAQIVPGKHVLAPRSNGVAFVSNINNPITGFEQRLPLSFDKEGDLLTLSGISYANQVRWSLVKDVVYQTNGKFIIWGEGVTKIPSGGWTNTRQLVAMYLKNGELDTVLYSSPEVAGVPAVIVNLALFQQVL